MPAFGGVALQAVGSFAEVRLSCRFWGRSRRSSLRRRRLAIWSVALGGAGMPAGLAVDVRTRGAYATFACGCSFLGTSSNGASSMITLRLLASRASNLGGAEHPVRLEQHPRVQPQACNAEPPDRSQQCYGFGQRSQDQSKLSLEGYMDQQPRAGKLDRQVQEQGVARVRVVLMDPLPFPKYLPYLSLLVGNPAA